MKDIDQGSGDVWLVFRIEVGLVWILFAVVSVEILLTYSRLPADELYHVSGSGLGGGASRALVFWNFPTALVAIPILALLAEQLPGRVPRLVSVAGVVLAAAVFWPGVVDQADLDARAVNTVAAVGVLIAIALTVFAALRLRGPVRVSRQPGDSLRVVLAGVVVAVSLPWIAADLGFFLDGVPVLRDLFQTGHSAHHPAGLRSFAPRRPPRPPPRYGRRPPRAHGGSPFAAGRAGEGARSPCRGVCLFGADGLLRDRQHRERFLD